MKLKMPYNLEVEEIPFCLRKKLCIKCGQEKMIAIDWPKMGAGNYCMKCLSHSKNKAPKKGMRKQDIKTLKW